MCSEAEVSAAIATERRERDGEMKNNDEIILSRCQCQSHTRIHEDTHAIHTSAHMRE